MALRGYLVEEVAQDFADGLLTRRDAMHRLALGDVSPTGTAAPLAACGGMVLRLLQP